jgi:hypothetical protein
MRDPWLISFAFLLGTFWERLGAFGERHVKRLASVRPMLLADNAADVLQVNAVLTNVHPQDG